jgi:hypothetical protein
MRLAAEAKVTMVSRRQGTRVEIRPQRLFSFVLYILPLPTSITFASHWIVCIYPTSVTAQPLDRVFDKPQSGWPAVPFPFLVFDKRTAVPTSIRSTFTASIHMTFDFRLPYPMLATQITMMYTFDC